MTAIRTIAGPAYGTQSSLPALPSTAYPERSTFVVTDDTNGETLYQNQSGTWIPIAAGSTITQGAAAAFPGPPTLSASIGHATDTTLNKTLAFTTTADVDTGQTITLCVAGTGAGSVTSVTGGTATWRAQKLAGGGAEPSTTIVTGYQNAPLASGSTITVTFQFNSSQKVGDAYSWNGLRDAVADATSSAISAGSAAPITNTCTTSHLDNQELLITTISVFEAQTDGQWTLGTDYTLFSTGSSAGSGPPLTILVAYKIVPQGSYSATGTLTGSAAWASVSIAMAGTAITGTLLAGNLIAGTPSSILKTSQSGAVGFISEPDIDLLEYVTNMDGSSDNGSGIASAIAALPTAGNFTGGVIAMPRGQLIANQPFILPTNSRMVGRGSESTVIKLGSTFPTATLNGSHTFPTGTTTLTSMPANAPTAGVFQVLDGAGAMITIVYSGKSGSTLTGCTTKGSGTYGNGSVVGWPLFQLGQSNGTPTGLAFSCRLESLTLNMNDIAGAGGIYSCRAQEKSGAWDVLIKKHRSYAIRIEPQSSGGVTAQNWGFRDLFILTSILADASCLDIWVSGLGPGTVKGRGFHGVTIDTNDGSTHVAGRAIHMDGIGGVTLEAFNVEHHDGGGLLIGGGQAGDCSAISVRQFTGDLVTMGGDLVQIGSGSNRGIILQQLRKGSCTNVINDLQHSTTDTSIEITSYMINSAGSVQTESVIDGGSA